MTTQDRNSIDVVAQDDNPRCVLLVVVEDRPWGDSGMLLPDLQAKLETYLNYVVTGQLVRDFPAANGEPVKIELRCASEPGEREREFLDIVVRTYFQPEGIDFEWRLLRGI